MRSSDIITAFIMSLLENSEGETEIKRNELAQQFNVVPSQINYVISSRFTPELGFITESRRGGGGYIKIRRVYSTAPSPIMHVINGIPNSITQTEARIILENLLANRIIQPHDARLMSSALSDKPYLAVPREYRDELRSSLMKNMLLAISASK
jgi:transcriptional regulator CtsR